MDKPNNTPSIRRVPRWAWFIILLYTIAPLPIPTSAQENTAKAPYYYFDDILGCFVVERADCTQPSNMASDGRQVVSDIHGLPMELHELLAHRVVFM